MPFSLLQVGVVVKLDYSRSNINIHPFLQFTPIASQPSPSDKPPEQGRAVQKNTGIKQEWASESRITRICSRALHFVLS